MVKVRLTGSIMLGKQFYQFNPESPIVELSESDARQAFAIGNAEYVNEEDNPFIKEEKEKAKEEAKAAKEAEKAAAKEKKEADKVEKESKKADKK